MLCNLQVSDNGHTLPATRLIGLQLFADDA